MLDHANAVLTAVGYDFRLIIKWLRVLLRKILIAVMAPLSPKSSLNPAS